MFTTLKFKWYKQKEIIELSDVEVTESRSLDKFGHPVENGFYDLKMGPCDKDQLCGTCGLDFISCPGHFGRVKIIMCYNPLTYDLLFSLLKSICFGCKKFKLGSIERLNFYLDMAKAELDIDSNNTNINIETYEQLEEIIKVSAVKSKDMDLHIKTVQEWIKRMNSKTKCTNCSHVNKKLQKVQNIKIVEEDITFTHENVTNSLTTKQICKTMQEVFENEKVLLEKMFSTSNDDLNLIGDMFFIENLLVSPNKFRPIKMRNGMLYENSINTTLSHILNMSLLTMTDEKYLCELQLQVNNYFDSNANTSNLNSKKEGIKQVLEKKEGLFRQNIMGKRVNYSARSVISPDPCLETGEIGVPLIFAQQLTFPEKLNQYNRKELYQLVVNGHFEYPSANYLKINNELISLKYLNDQKRKEYADRFIKDENTLSEIIVHRHLRDGDKLLVNRQPTLHVVSLMGHTAKVLKNEKTLRMHYVNCKPYNADFDGDEMNIHFPQSIQAISEIEEVCGTDRLYFVPSTNAPIRGLTQDHIVVAAVLTSLESYFTESEYKQIVYNSLYSYVYKNNKKLRFLEGSICCGNVTYYTGKDIISTILMNLDMEMTGEIKCKISKKEEDQVIIIDSTMVKGILDKNTLGTTKNSLIHILGEKYGFKVCNVLLTVFGRMVNEYMKYRGFTLRYDDLLINAMGEKEIEQDLYKFYKNNNSVKEVGTLLKNVNEATSELQSILDKNMHKNSMNNNMLNIIKSGAKGSTVNLSQISICLGQQELEGKRVPQQRSGKSLPCFTSREYFTNVSAGGFVLERFLFGLKPSSFYFHCMAGREGLIDTAVKTANSGYLQRCLVKHMEGVTTQYDQTIRMKNNSNRIISYYSADAPGTSVGVIAAQSIGEPSTQMTLNTFHLAGVGGRNVTLGIPRLREIVMVASKKIKTPSISFHGVEKKISNSLVNIFNVVTAYDLVKSISLKENYVKDKNFVCNGYSKRISIEIALVQEVISDKELLKLFVSKLNSTFLKTFNKLMKVKLSAIEIVDGDNDNKSVVNDETDSDSSDSNHSENDPGESNFHNKNISKEESEHTEKTLGDVTEDSDVTDDKNDEPNDDTHNDVLDSESVFRYKNKRVTLCLRYPSNFKSNILEHVEHALKKTVVKEISGFSGCKSIPNGDACDVYLDGSSFVDLFNLPIVHSNQQLFYSGYSNDIFAVYTNFGVEAARSVIVSEIENVFDVYGICIESKHLELVADYMLRNGEYGAFNRHCFTSNDSIIQRMSFESCFANIKEASRYMLSDSMNNPSSIITVGGKIKNGTGVFDVMYDFSVSH